MLTAILSLTPLGGNLAIEAAIANMLAAQGDRILFITCDSSRPRCILDNFFKPGIDRLDCCSLCHSGTQDYLDQLGLKAASHVDLLTLTDLAELSARYALIDELSDEDVFRFRYDGMPLDEWLVDGLKLAYFGESWQRLPDLQQVAKNMLKAMLQTHLATHTLIDRFRPQTMLLLNGLIPAEHVAWEVGRRRSVHTVLYEGGQRPGTIHLSTEQPACFYDISDAWESWRHVPLSRAESNGLDAFMVKRMYQGAAGYVYSPTATGSGDALRSELGLAADVPLMVAFTNCSADTSVLRSNTLFAQQIDWIDACIRFAQGRPDMALVIRIHPVEGSTSTFREGRVVGVRDKIADGISALWPDLPGNIRVVDARDRVSSYDLMQEASVVLAYVSTVGIEAAMLGKPVVNAGSYHYTDKGFTYCPKTPDAYVALLERLIADPAPLPHAVELARRYMHLWMDRSMLPVPSLDVDATSGNIRLRIHPISDYGRGRHAAYDHIVDFLQQRHGAIESPADWRPRDQGPPEALPIQDPVQILAAPEWERLPEFARSLLQVPAGVLVNVLAGDLEATEAAQRLISALLPLASPAAWPDLETVDGQLPEGPLGVLMMEARALLSSRRLPHDDRLAIMARHAGVPIVPANDSAAVQAFVNQLHAPVASPQPA